MKKNLIIITLAIFAMVSSCSSYRMSNEAATLLKECKLASNVINQVISDCPDYFYDVLVETDAWQEYIEVIPFDYYE